MFSVALIGADGAGKTTIAREIEKLQPLPIKYIYMGVNPGSSNLILPSTRLILAIKRALGMQTDMGGPPDRTRVKARTRSAIKRCISTLKSSLHVVNMMSEEWYRQCISWYYQKCGYVVLYDRHFLSDYYASDIAGAASNRSLARRIHGFVLNRFYPNPDLVIFLDAPASVLFARKGEGTLTLLESRRQEYWQQLERVEHCVVVDASQPQDEVLREVIELIKARALFRKKVGTFASRQNCFSKEKQEKPSEDSLNVD
ncbi:MAG: hypothetical protein AB1649_21295 [Chloroflexota bacterium]